MFDNAKIEVEVAGYTVLAGTGKESGKPYSIPTLYLVESLKSEVTQDDNGNSRTLEASGGITKKYGCSYAFVNELKGKKFPLKCIVTVSSMTKKIGRDEQQINVINSCTPIASK